MIFPLSPQFQEAMMLHIYEEGHLVNRQWFDPRLGQCYGMWIDPLFMYMMGWEVDK